MARLHCSHDSPFLPHPPSTPDNWCDCPAHGNVFAVALTPVGLPIQQTARHLPPKPARRPSAKLAADGLDAIYPSGPRSGPADLTAPGSCCRQDVTLEGADKLRLPSLPHLQAGAYMGPLLWNRPVVGRLGQSGRSLSSPKIQKLYTQLTTVIDRARHLHFKSLGSLLKLQEEIARRWLIQFASERRQP